MFYPLDIGFDESVKQRLMDIDPFDTAAGLARIEKSAIDQILHRVVEVGIFSYVSRILAT